MRIFARDMSRCTGFELPDGTVDIAASEQFLYTTGSDNEVCCLTHDGTLVGVLRRSR